jgi:hypothetical protein
MIIPSYLIAAAQSSHKKFFPRGPFVSVSLAQWALESAYGRAEPPASNNPFGIKALPGQPSVAAMTHETLHGVYEANGRVATLAAQLQQANQAKATLEGRIGDLEKQIAAAKPAPTPSATPAPDVK